MASRTDRFIDGMFSGRVNPKDGYAVVDCKESIRVFSPIAVPGKANQSYDNVG